jgi:predicted membrane chloride channel (bestrophin family)
MNDSHCILASTEDNNHSIVTLLNNQKVHFKFKVFLRSGLHPFVIRTNVVNRPNFLAEFVGSDPTTHINSCWTHSQNLCTNAEPIMTMTMHIAPTTRKSTSNQRLRRWLRCSSYWLLTLLVVVICDQTVPTVTARRRRGGYRHSRSLPRLPWRPIATKSSQTSTTTTTSINPGDTLELFLADIRRLEQISSEAQTPILSKTHSTRDSSYTRSWTHDDWELHQVKSFHRYSAHIRSWLSSPTFHSTVPTLLITFGWTLVCILAVSQCKGIRHFVQQSPISSSTSSFSSPIGILLALKTNRALNRILEARNQWGKMIRVCTSLSGMVVNYISPVDDETGLLVGRYLALFGWCMKGMLRGGEDDTLVITTLLPPAEATWLLNCPCDRPSAIIFRFRHILASLIQNESTMSATASGVMEDRLEELEQAMGVIRRILASPIPPTFTRMTSRTLCLFLFFLPLALVGSGTNPVAILVMATLLSYIFVGIDEISVEVEHPFPLLPMFTLAKNIEKNVCDQFVMMKDLKAR